LSCRVRTTTIFGSDFGHEERECRSPRGDASIDTVRSRGNCHCADREFVFADLALIAWAAPESRKINWRRRNSTGKSG